MDSIEILKAIKKNIVLFLVVFSAVFSLGTIKILSIPKTYEVKADFRYEGIEPTRVTVKKDTRGLIVLQSYEIGEGNLDIETLLKGEEFTEVLKGNSSEVEYDSEKGIYTVTVKGENPGEIRDVLNSYMTLLMEKNRLFLVKKLDSENSIRIKRKILEALKYPEKNFSQITIENIPRETDNKKTAQIFFLFFISIFMSITGVFAMLQIKEAGKRE